MSKKRDVLYTLESKENHFIITDKEGRELLLLSPDHHALRKVSFLVLADYLKDDEKANQYMVDFTHSLIRLINGSKTEITREHIENFLNPPYLTEGVDRNWKKQQFDYIL